MNGTRNLEVKDDKGPKRDLQIDLLWSHLFTFQRVVTPSGPSPSLLREGFDYIREQRFLSFSQKDSQLCSFSYMSSRTHNFRAPLLYFRPQPPIHSCTWWLLYHVTQGEMGAWRPGANISKVSESINQSASDPKTLCL